MFGRSVGTAQTRDVDLAAKASTTMTGNKPKAQPGQTASNPSESTAQTLQLLLCMLYCSCFIHLFAYF